MARAALLLALAACLALGVSAQLPVSLEQAGGPAFLEGLHYVVNATDDTAVATGYIFNGTVTWTFLYEDGPYTTTGRYLSWECLGNGTYNALLEYQEVDPDGTKSALKRTCEYGIASAEEGYNKWVWNEEECPVEWDGEFYSITVISDTTMNPCGEPAAEESPYTSASTGSTEADATAAADSATAIIDGAAEDVAADATEDATTADTIEVAA